MNLRQQRRVGLVTLWYRAAATIDRFVDELHALRYSAVRPVFVINSLAAADVERLRDRVPEALVLEPGANLGTAAGWNLAIRHLLDEGVDVVGTWNVDTRFDRDCVTKLVDLLEGSPEIGACQPLVCDFDTPRRVQMFGGSLDLSTGRARHDFSGADVCDALPALRDAEYLDGGCMFLRAEVLRSVGGFDERFYMYAEDCDLSVRVRRAGYRTVALRDARVWHERREDRTHLPPPHEVFYRTRNRYFLLRKYASRRALRLESARGLLWDMPRSALFYVRRGRFDLAQAHTSGLLNGVAGRFGKHGWVND